MARPAVDGGNVKVLRLRVSERVHAALKAYALAKGRTISDSVRVLICDSLGIARAVANEGGEHAAD